MLFRRHTRFSLCAYNSLDSGFRGAVRLENRKNRFWMDVQQDIGRVEDPEDSPELLCVSYLRQDDVASEVVAVLDGSATSINRQAYGLAAYPALYGEFVEKIARRMSELATSALQTALWRSGARGGPTAFYAGPWGLFWCVPRSNESPNWRQVPIGVMMLDLPDASFELPAENASAAAQLVEGGEGQPLGHDLLREAWNVHESNPRSALVIAVAAIEVGLKHFVAQLLPDTIRLLHNMPSPPLHKLLRELVPTIPSRATGQTVITIDKALVRVVQDAIEKRNALVHAGAGDISEEWLLTLLKEVRRLLYLLDYHRGHPWALEMQT